MTFSAGVAQFPEHGKDLQTLYQAADEALYQAKKAGRDSGSAGKSAPITILRLVENMWMSPAEPGGRSLYILKYRLSCYRIGARPVVWIAVALACYRFALASLLARRGPEASCRHRHRLSHSIRGSPTFIACGVGPWWHLVLGNSRPRRQPLRPSSRRHAFP